MTWAKILMGVVLCLGVVAGFILGRLTASNGIQEERTIVEEVVKTETVVRTEYIHDVVEKKEETESSEKVVIREVKVPCSCGSGQNVVYVPDTSSGLELSFNTSEYQIITERIEERTDSHRTEEKSESTISRNENEERKEESKEEKKDVDMRDKWIIGGGGAYEQGGSAQMILEVDRRIVGPVWIGAYGTASKKNKSIGGKILFSF